jgi:predicted CoA-binding protein
MSIRPSSEALAPFFDPCGVAVIGASRDPAKVGGSVLANLRAAGFEGRIWPVNPRADVVQGLPATASLLAIDEPVDLAVIAVPAPGVQPALKECVAKGIRGAIVLSAGFREAGEAGQAREAELRAWIREQPIRVLGPNCLGWIRPSRRLNATFAPGMPPAGGIAFLSHSGALATAILDWARARRLGFSFFATLLKLIGGVTAAVASVYGGYVALTYVRFGRGSGKGERNRMLDQFMPVYEIRERHSVSVWAPADVTLAAAREISFYDSRLARSIFALRALPGRFLGVPPAPTERQSFFDEVIALGWRELAHTPGRAVIMGAVTQPWRQQVVFRGQDRVDARGRANGPFIVGLLHRDACPDHRSGQPRALPALLGLPLARGPDHPVRDASAREGGGRTSIRTPVQVQPTFSDPSGVLMAVRGRHAVVQTTSGASASTRRRPS